MILEVYQDIIDEMQKCPSYFYNNNLYVRVMEDQLKDVLEEQIFSKMETKNGRKDKIALCTPINYLKKIVNKLNIYTFDTAREVSSDKDLYEYHFNQIKPYAVLQKGCGLYSGSKSVLMEIYVNKKMQLKWRAIPNDRYYLYTTDKIDNTTPEYVVKIIETISYKCNQTGKLIEADLLYIYSETEFLAVDTAGRIWQEYMPNGTENPLGFMPFVHVNQDYSNIVPKTDKDTLTVILQCCSILTDANVANFYQAFPRFTATGIDKDKSSFGGNPGDITILNAPEGSDVVPTFSVVPSALDTSKSVDLATKLFQMLMDIKGLKVNSEKASAGVSGVQELINNSDTTEVRKAYVNDWEPAEEEMWEKTAMYNNWLVKNKAALLPKKWPKKQFSEDFQVIVEFDNVDTNVEQKVAIAEESNGEAAESSN